MVIISPTTQKKLKISSSFQVQSGLYLVVNNRARCLGTFEDHTRQLDSTHSSEILIAYTEHTITAPLGKIILFQ